MRKTIITALVLCTCLSSVAVAHDFKIGYIQIAHPWTRPADKTGAGFFKIINNGTESDRLMGGTLATAGKFEMHETTMQNGVAKMRALPPEGLEIKPGQTVEFKPGGNHVMFMNLSQPIKAGDMIKGTLVFQKAGTVQVEYMAEKAGGASGHTGH